ncbi:MAG: PhoH family protein [Planctomycetota bacterium]
MNPLQLENLDVARALCGPHDQNLRLVRQRFEVQILVRGLQVSCTGDDAEAAHALLASLLAQARQQGELTREQVLAALDAARPLPGSEPPAKEELGLLDGIKLRSEGQRRYVAQLREHDLVFAVGPAGTGKTYLAVLMAVQALKVGRVRRIVLCRPAVEAGEKLGYLPGDFQAKVNPYMRPLYDALYSLIDYDTVKRYMEREVIEVAPLAYMRGRTLSDAFVILDEAQNTTRAQMKMFLTRMGEGSKIVVTGDVTQVDLPPGVTSGLVHAQSILKGVKGIGFALLTSKDVVRHALVSRIVRAYEGRKGEGR